MDVFERMYKVEDAILSELRYQDRAGGNSLRTGDDAGELTLGETVAVLAHLNNELASTWYKEGQQTETCKILRKIATSCIRAMSNYEAPKRDFKL